MQIRAAAGLPVFECRRFCDKAIGILIHTGYIVFNTNPFNRPSHRQETEQEESYLLKAVCLCKPLSDERSGTAQAVTERDGKMPIEQASFFIKCEFWQASI